MDWSQLLNAILIPGLVGLGGLFVWYVKFQVPKNDARKELELIARLENQKDRREHSQASENIAIEILRDITRESIQEHSKESQEMRDVINRNTQVVRALVKVIGERD